MRIDRSCSSPNVYCPSQLAKRNADRQVVEKVTPPVVDSRLDVGHMAQSREMARVDLFPGIRPPESVNIG
jgi:hypothetical protein